MSYYKTCPDCGSHLDPGELCECKKNAAASAPDTDNGGCGNEVRWSALTDSESNITEQESGIKTEDYAEEKEFLSIAVFNTIDQWIEDPEHSAEAKEIALEYCKYRNIPVGTGMCTAITAFAVGYLYGMRDGLKMAEL